MADLDRKDPLLEDELPEEMPGDRFKWVLVLAGIAIVIGIVALWMTKGDRENRRGTESQLTRELNLERDGLRAQQEKVVELSQRVERMKALIETGEIKGEKAVADYKALANEQRAAREAFIKMANDYNAKVSRLDAQKQ